MLILRLQRVGKRNDPSYRLIVSEKSKNPHGRILENLGKYNPVNNPKVIELNKERIDYWISVGAQTSNSVNNLLINQGLIKGDKKKSVFLSKRRKEKLTKEKAAAEAPKA